MATVANHHMNRFFLFLFILILIAQVLMFTRQTEIDYPVIFHVLSLGIFLFFGLLTILLKPQDFTSDALITLALVFVIYFYTIGVIISLLYGGKLQATVEFPYRIANLFMVLVIPYFVRQEKDLKLIFVLILVMMGLQIVRDISIGTGGQKESLLLERLLSKDFASCLFLGALPFSIGALIAYWNVPSHKIIKRLLLLGLWAFLVLKLFLTFSRAVWLGIIPLNIVGTLYLVRKKYQVMPEFRQWGKRATRIFIFLILLGIGTMTVITLFYPKVLNFIDKRASKTGQEVNNRMAEYHDAIREWYTSPVWGKGFAYQAHIIKGSRVLDRSFIHNFALQFLMSSGIIGLLLITFLLGKLFFRLLSLYKKTYSVFNSAIMIACLLTVLNITVLGLVSTVILKQEVWFLIALCISIKVIVNNLEHNKVQTHTSYSKLNKAMF